MTDFYNIFVNVLLRQIGGQPLHEALATRRAVHIVHGREETKVAVENFVKPYKSSRYNPIHGLPALSLQSAIALAPLQRSVQFSIEDFCRSAFSMHAGSGSLLNQSSSLSASERARLRRAFYRIQLFCALFVETLDNRCWHIHTLHKSFLFLVLFPHWEVEEFACIQD